MSEVSAPSKPASQWTRQNPFPGKLIVNKQLSTPDSEKDTRHFEIDLTNWGLSFEPGDSVAVYPTNDPPLVDEIIHALGAKGDEPVLAGKTHQAASRSAAARLFDHPTDTEIFEGDCRTRLGSADVEGTAAPGSQT